MRKPKLIWQLYPSYLLVTLAAVLAIGWYATASVESFYRRHVEQGLEARSRLLRERVSEMVAAGEHERLDVLCKQLGREAATRITVVLRDGKVVADSEEDPAEMENHANRPEIRAAYADGVGSSIRFSTTLGKDMMYVAIPVTRAGKPVAVVRTSLPLTDVMAAAGRLYVRILGGGVIVAVLAAVVSLVISRRIARPLSEMREVAESFAGGKLGARLPAQTSAEMSGLADAMNMMAAQLDERIKTVTEQRNELEALLSSMIEAVIAVDPTGRVLRMNEAAARLSGVGAAQAEGRDLEGVIRNSDLQKVIHTALTADGPAEGEVVIPADTGEKVLQAHGTCLRDSSGQSIGAVVVLNDVTRLKVLENMRREFVANVSHELRTPVTTVKGFLETVREGKLNDPSDAARFLDIAARQVDRLNAIIEDLLGLSRIEQSEDEGVTRERHRVRDILENVLTVCGGRAAAKNIPVELDCAGDLTANVNSALLEQAVINLIDNAVKYSEEGSPVTVRARLADRELTIEVSDKGCGIAAEHLPRIFERFYLVDKARSRKLGGTGLGLAIVKHITRAHGGTVAVHSTPGEGSTFTMHIPTD